MMGKSNSNQSHKPKWYTGLKDPSAQQYLPALLEHATGQHRKDADWFINSRDKTITQLGAVLTAEVLIARFLLDSSEQLFIVAIFSFCIMALSLLAAKAGSVNCNRSYEALLESIALKNKIVWAMGQGKKVGVKPMGTETTNVPFGNDETLYVPRWMEDAFQYKTTKEFTEYFLGEAKGSPYNIGICKVICSMIGGLWKKDKEKRIYNTYLMAWSMIWTLAIVDFTLAFCLLIYSLYSFYLNFNKPTILSYYLFPYH